MGGKGLRKAAWTLLLIMLSLALLSLCACRTARKAERETVVRDTLRIISRDTVRKDVLRESVLTVFVKDSTSSVQDTAGRPLFRDRLRTVYIYRDKRDSSAFYKAAASALAIFCEAKSFVGHFLYLRGVEVRAKSVSAFLKAFTVTLVKRKSRAMGEAIEEGFNTIDKEKDNG